jgi:hypothetical protein
MNLTNKDEESISTAGSNRDIRRPSMISKHHRNIHGYVMRNRVFGRSFHEMMEVYLGYRVPLQACVRRWWCVCCTTRYAALLGLLPLAQGGYAQGKEKNNWRWELWPRSEAGKGPKFCIENVHFTGSLHFSYDAGLGRLARYKKLPFRTFHGRDLRVPQSDTLPSDMTIHFNFFSKTSTAHNESVMHDRSSRSWAQNVWQHDIPPAPKKNTKLARTVYIWVGLRQIKTVTVTRGLILQTCCCFRLLILHTCEREGPSRCVMRVYRKSAICMQCIHTVFVDSRAYSFGSSHCALDESLTNDFCFLRYNQDWFINLFTTNQLSHSN